MKPEAEKAVLHLSNSELLLLAEVPNVSLAVRARLPKVASVGGDELSLSEDEADDLRNALIEELSRTGFDAAYEPTSRGRMLESLADRIHALIG